MQVAAELNRVRPVQIVRPCFQPWRGGVLSLHKVVERLQSILPPTFEELDKACPVRPAGARLLPGAVGPDWRHRLLQAFAVGVVSSTGQYKLVSSGALPQAVAASIAIPFIFAGVDVPGEPRRQLAPSSLAGPWHPCDQAWRAGQAGNPHKDGGMVDRVGLTAWRRLLESQADAQPARVRPSVVHLITRSSRFSGIDDARALGGHPHPPPGRSRGASGPCSGAPGAQTPRRLFSSSHRGVGPAS